MCLTQSPWWTSEWCALDVDTRSVNGRIIEAMVDAGEPLVIGDQLHYVGTDSRGVALEVIAVPDDRNPGGLAVIHAMPTSFRGEEGDGP